MERKTNQPPTEQKKMKLEQPFIISARLMPALRIGDAYLSLNASPRNYEGRNTYSGWLDLDSGESHELSGFASGCQGGGLQSGFESVLCFLAAAAESYRYRGLNWDGVEEDDNASLFSREVTEWAYGNSDEISMLELELSENSKLIS